MGFLVNAVPTLVPVASFAAYLLMGRNLSAAEAFTSLSLFQVLRFPLFQLPQIITQATQAQVALGRLHQLLSAEEVTSSHGSASSPGAANGVGHAAAAPAAADGAGDVTGDVIAPAVSLHGDFTWDPDRAPTLVDLDLDIPRGKLIAVVGSTGAGKTSFLMAALGQMPQARGPPPRIEGSVALVPQAPFVLAGSVRDNILFGLPYEEGRYSRAVRAACLEQDFEALPAGDATELGERGINISGGQKQRVSIARAIYADSDVVLLDDPLSALDARVARRVYDLGVRQALARKTVVLATNQLQFATHPAVHTVVFMRDGRAEEVGTLDELMAIPGGGFAALVRETQLEENDGEKSSQDDDVDKLDEASPGDAAGDAAGGKAPPAGDGKLPIAAAAAVAGGPGAVPGGRLVQAEGAASGRVSKEVVAAYVKSCGGWGVVGVLGSFYVTSEALRVGTSLWLSYWTSVVDDPHPSYTPKFFMTW
ncbi:hypothetical protein MNEG_11795 [Monoraphidium neglectum]|uniref:ABC transporter domain-containing protein n=1 Tax=Monoraphidium neglectum TaxID=145388 RepID=A0A0D2M4J0_9CHLO|nr:hypothetical protein MNEG_11795 [Monoraphidium neglectum]KIY96166.1 hypothetical protein MNEG_11795 [Monoraphidium neglectum]|eukprot:XP_013895186.1 hypothetical protein MNEG_11795 [Monoraphidium neglectum]